MIFEKIRERLEEQTKRYQESIEGQHSIDYRWIEEEGLQATEEAIDIINQAEAEYNNGWIPCSERLPETNDAVNIVWVNRKPEPYYEDIKDKPFTATGHYHKGKWYWYSVVCKDYLDEYGTSNVDEVDEYIDIIAWQPLPKPYTPKGE